MIREAEAKGLIIYRNSAVYITLMASEPDVNGEMHDEQKGFPGYLFKREQRNWDVEKRDQPCIHASVLKRTKNSNNLNSPSYSPWILNNEETIKPIIEI